MGTSPIQHFDDGFSGDGCEEGGGVEGGRGGSGERDRRWWGGSGKGGASVSWTAVTEDHKLGAFKQQKLVLSQFWRPDIQDQGAAGLVR